MRNAELIAVLKEQLYSLESSSGESEVTYDDIKQTLNQLEEQTPLFDAGIFLSTINGQSSLQVNVAGIGDSLCYAIAVNLLDVIEQEVNKLNKKTEAIANGDFSELDSVALETNVA